MVLEGPLFAQYFEKVQATNFEVASDAFQTFKDLLTRHKPLVGSYLNSHYEEVWSCSAKASCMHLQPPRSLIAHMLCFCSVAYGAAFLGTDEVSCTVDSVAQAWGSGVVI